MWRKKYHDPHSQKWQMQYKYWKREECFRQEGDFPVKEKKLEIMEARLINWSKVIKGISETESETRNIACGGNTAKRQGICFGRWLEIVELKAQVKVDTLEARLLLSIRQQVEKKRCIESRQNL